MAERLLVVDDEPNMLRLLKTILMDKTGYEVDTTNNPLEVLDYSWMGGWRKSQDAEAERNLLIVIRGRNRHEAVIMADHYDTAYMEDKYKKDAPGGAARVSACDADDNHSATAAMMLAAPIFLEMSRRGKLDCDIWLVHLTGEEFPADCLGARALTERLVTQTLAMRLPRGKSKDLSRTTIRGVYVSDMIAHNHDRERDIFQISPGKIPDRSCPGSSRPS